MDDINNNNKTSAITSQPDGLNRKGTIKYFV